MARRLLAAAIVLSTTLSGQALARPQCDAREAVLDVLATKYKEAPISMGVTHNGGLVEVLTAEDGSTWSIIVTTPQGMSCLVAAGEGWRTGTPRLAVPVDPGA